MIDPSNICHSIYIHYCDIIMNAMASQITSLAIVYSTFHSGADQRKHQSSASLVFVRGIHRWPVNFPHKGPITWIFFSIRWRHHVMGPNLSIIPLPNVITNSTKFSAGTALTELRNKLQWTFSRNAHITLHLSNGWWLSSIIQEIKVHL